MLDDEGPRDGQVPRGGIDGRHCRGCPHRRRGASARSGHRFDAPRAQLAAHRSPLAPPPRRGDDVEARRPRARARRSHARGGRRDLGGRARSPGAATGGPGRDRAAREHDERDARPPRARAEAATRVRVRRVARAALARRVDPRAGRSRARAPGRARRRPSSPRACSPKTCACRDSSRISCCSPAPTSRPCPWAGDPSISTTSSSRRRAGCAPTTDCGSTRPASRRHASLGDESALRRVVVNLAENAARHARTKVSFALKEESGSAVLDIADDGPGIPEADRARVFERFVRLDDARGARRRRQRARAGDRRPTRRRAQRNGADRR